MALQFSGSGTPLKTCFIIFTQIWYEDALSPRTARAAGVICAKYATCMGRKGNGGALNEAVLAYSILEAGLPCAKCCTGMQTSLLLQ